MAIFEQLNLPFLIGAIGILLFFLWLGKHAERMDKKRENIKKAQVMREKLQKMKNI